MSELLRWDLQLFAEEKTEEPTEKKRRDTRKKGQVAKSQELGVAASIIALFAGFHLWGDHLVRGLYQFTYRWFFTLGDKPVNVESVGEIAKTSVTNILYLTMPVFLVSITLGLFVNFAQVGFMYTPAAISPKLERLNPLEGLKRVFSKRALVQLVKSLAKLTLLGVVAYVQIRRDYPALVASMGLSIEENLVVFGQWILSFGMRLGWILLALAVFDYAYQRWEYTQNIKMTKEELKEEYKQTEGDQLVRSRIRRKQRELATRRMMQMVPKADVVITNPTHIAVALAYDLEQRPAPVVVAKGKGPVAERIKDIARENDVYIMENPPLARTLYQSVEINHIIPEELFQAVAEVLAFVYRLKGKTL
ncbi:MAG: flagellar biosynthesis protein FlhB [Limnochordia bacterium]|jgi:flagellar biosynthetic protein FlhB|nr:flagellar biosynthesis protein FlhB [Limnochordia bacterium]MDD2629269.1 flagellar biosynthesis protein FlhB [Limnochordia bacterium]MDD4517273.1 flagellar biosynthesis protein FlhB [Limnochordia bacterium]